jgi:hypothetical protein
MFRAFSCPTSGEQDCVSLPMVFCPVQRMLQLQHLLHNAHISLPDSPEPQQLQPGQNTMGSDMQFCSPDEGRKDARNMLRNNCLPINHHLLRLVCLAFICLSKVHRHSNIKCAVYCVATEDEGAVSSKKFGNYQTIR